MAEASAKRQLRRYWWTKGRSRKVAFPRQSAFASRSMKHSTSVRIRELRCWKNMRAKCLLPLPERSRNWLSFWNQTSSATTSDADCTRNWRRRWRQFSRRQGSALQDGAGSMSAYGTKRTLGSINFGAASAFSRVLTGNLFALSAGVFDFAQKTDRPESANFAAVLSRKRQCISQTVFRAQSATRSASHLFLACRYWRSSRSAAITCTEPVIA